MAAEEDDSRQFNNYVEDAADVDARMQALQREEGLFKLFANFFCFIITESSFVLYLQMKRKDGDAHKLFSEISHVLLMSMCQS